MDYFILCLTSFCVAALTLFSGFGLGTLLLPAFSFFFPIEIAVAATALVHLANNIFKVAIVGRMANPSVTLRFTLPALITSALGAMLLIHLGALEPLTQYSFIGKTYRIELIKLTLGILIGGFALLDLSPQLGKMSLPSKYIPLGGALSGFFGGLSGMQGAVRSMFLIRAGLSKEAFIGTSVVSAILIDFIRLLVYGNTQSIQFVTLREAGILGLVISGSLSALAGTLIGSRLVKKVTLETVKKIVGGLLLLVSLGLCAGLI